GLEFATWLDYGSAELMKVPGLRPLDRSKRLFQNILAKHDVRGRVSFCGVGKVQSYLPVISAALAARPEMQLAEEADMEAVVAARATKAEPEVARMRDVARRTEEVVAEVCGLLRARKVEGGLLRRADGAPLKIGEVKDRIGLELARRRLDDHGHTIFAAGREAGFPHSRGTETEPVPAGKPIIFDIFPQEKGGGYYFDFTRTLWVGPVSDRVRACFDAVQAAFDRSVAAAKPGRSAREPDDAACDALEERGFVTKRQDMKTQVGYCHSLGHGVGLEIHERPSLSQNAANQDVLAPGMVFTIEPGLYFPDEEIGIRLEDTFYLRTDGTLENLSTLPKSPEALLAARVGS
ncbi:MAG TPA: M24 family metallopeptidase, partial [Planctomycetota bacterium]|nr:M24 family metallopeptidase [Planctomycetota bacterium]